MTRVENKGPLLTFGAFLGRFRRATCPSRGCDFGGRPIDQNIKGFEDMGAA
jgi:UDP-N-acetylglucosamine 1-carboxyvinyltransferase